MALNPNQMTTGEARLSYVHLDKPYAHDGNQNAKYSVTVLLPKSDTDSKARLDAAYQAAVQKGITDKWNGVQPPVIANPIYDGDGVRPNGEAFGAECRGCWVFTASSTNPVPVIDTAQNPIIQASEVYSGCYGRVCVSLFPYSVSGKRGIGIGLEAVQKLRDGDPLGGGVSIADAFGRGAPASRAPVAGNVTPTDVTQSRSPLSPPQGGGAYPFQTDTTGGNGLPDRVNGGGHFPQQGYQMPEMRHPNGATYDPITGTYGW